MPRVLPRCERGLSPVDEGTDPLPGVFQAVSEGVKDLQKFVEEVDEDVISVSLPELHKSPKARDNGNRSPTVSSAVASGFDLAEIRVRLDTFISGDEDRLELEPLPKHQRKQVALLISAHGGQLDMNMLNPCSAVVHGHPVLLSPPHFSLLLTSRSSAAESIFLDHSSSHAWWLEAWPTLKSPATQPQSPGSLLVHRNVIDIHMPG